jgi:hypothetical protein
MKEDKIMQQQPIEHCSYAWREHCNILNCDINNVHECPLAIDNIHTLNDMEKYLRTFNPKELIRYKNYIRKDNPPKIGDTVVAITNGFNCSSSGGTIMKVIGINSAQELTLQSISGHYCCSAKDWWYQITIIKSKTSE